MMGRVYGTTYDMREREFLALLDPGVSETRVEYDWTWEPWFFLAAVFLACLFWELRRRNKEQAELILRLQPRVIEEAGGRVRESPPKLRLDSYSGHELSEALEFCEAAKRLSPAAAKILVVSGVLGSGADGTLAKLRQALGRQPRSKTTLWDLL